MNGLWPAWCLALYLASIRCHIKALRFLLMLSELYGIIGLVRMFSPFGASAFLGPLANGPGLSLAHFLETVGKPLSLKQDRLVARTAAGAQNGSETFGQEKRSTVVNQILFLLRKKNKEWSRKNMLVLCPLPYVPSREATVFDSSFLCRLQSPQKRIMASRSPTLPASVEPALLSSASRRRIHHMWSCPHWHHGRTAVATMGCARFCWQPAATLHAMCVLAWAKVGNVPQTEQILSEIK
jgi:hypothetical protein